ncbi:MAG TPA: hypothetical protein PK280_06310 [Planctomycetota bacterium]|nr:hypothetical protein [Planctomycetota bacterium]
MRGAGRLVAAGADVRIADSSADNLYLCCAARKASIKMVQLLLDAGAPLTCGVLEEALDTLRPEMVAFLLERPIRMIRPLLNTVNNNRFEVILCHAALDAGERSAKQQAERCSHLLAKMRPDLLANPAARYDLRKLVRSAAPEAWVGTLAECLRHKVGSEPLTQEETAVLAIHDLDDAIHHDGLQAIPPQYPATTIFAAAEAAGGLGVPRVAAAIKAIARYLRRAGLRPDAPRLAERLEDLWESDQAAVHRLEAAYFKARRAERFDEALATFVRTRADRFPG